MGSDPVSEVVERIRDRSGRGNGTYLPDRVKFSQFSFATKTYFTEALALVRDDKDRQ